MSDNWWSHRWGKRSFAQRLDALRKWQLISAQQEEFLCPSHQLNEFSEAMIENAVGVFAVPLGLAENFLIDDHWIRIPMATEEPSVIAAATFAAGIFARHGGFSTTASPPVVIGQTVVEDVCPDAIYRVEQEAAALVEQVNMAFPRMYQRGGGAQRLQLRMLDDHTLSSDLYVDTRDAMGANTVTRMMEYLVPQLEKITDGRRLFSVISNHLAHRVYRAKCTIPFSQLRRGRYRGEEMADRLLRISEIARKDPIRAVTHNKGIMNGVHALALATGNDTRAVESAIHAAALATGQYRGIGSYTKKDAQLHINLELPLALASTGGATMHPAAVFSLALLAHGWKGIDTTRLGRSAVALGLAQNFAALMALTTEGILPGHLRQHERRLRWLRSSS